MSCSQGEWVLKVLKGSCNQFVYEQGLFAVTACTLRQISRPPLPPSSQRMPSTYTAVPRVGGAWGEGENLTFCSAGKSLIADLIKKTMHLWNERICCTLEL